VAGLAGSGHDFWQEVLGQCVEAGACREVAAGGLSHFMQGRLSRRQAQVTAAWAAEGLDSSSRLLVLNSLYRDGSRHAYPSSLSDNSYPHVDTLSKAAAENGASLRVILMLRDTNHLLSSAGKLFQHPRGALKRGARKLYKQLLAVPRENILCVKYSNLGKESVRDHVQEFLSNGAAADDIHSFDFSTSMSEAWHGNSPNTCTGNQCHAPRLARAIGKLHEFCGGGSLERVLAEQLELSKEEDNEENEEEEEEEEEDLEEQVQGEPESSEAKIPRGPSSAAKIVSDVVAAANEAASSGDWLYGSAL